MSAREYSMADAVEVLGLSDDTIRKYIRRSRADELGILAVRGGQGRGRSGAYWLTIDPDNLPDGLGRPARQQRPAVDDTGLRLELTRLQVEVGMLRAERDRLADDHTRLLQIVQTALERVPPA